MSKKSTPFDKFAKRKSNAAIKEQFKQEKRKWKKEREDFFEKKRSLKSGPKIQESRVSRPLGRAQSSSVTTQGTSPARQRQPGGTKSETSEMPLNKFIAHCGVCSRRDAAEIVKQGKVKVNDAVVTEPGQKVSVKDKIMVNGKRVMLAKNLVYILLNKPKDYITTTDDPQNRKTVLDIIRNATKERVYPVGRLDRNTSGVLLLTNDGDLSQHLTHPSHEVKKIYAVTLDKPLDKKDFEKILQGVTLEDGDAKVDTLAYTDGKDKTQIGVEIHSGRNRIVRRIFEQLGYDVKNLDRVMFAGLTKKNISRGKWRFLTEKEIRDLKYFGKGNR
jgi:23S rRNA pseudouridine2605 synthase